MTTTDRASAQQTATPDMVRVHVLGGFDPFMNVKRRDNHFHDVERSSFSIVNGVARFGDQKVDLMDEDEDPINCIDIVELRPLDGDELTEGRALFERNVLRLEETSRMFHHEGLCVGQDPERAKIESTTAGSIISTAIDVVISGEDGPVPLFSWADVAKVTGTEGTAENGLHEYVPLRVFLLDGTIVEIHGRVVWECFS